VQSISEEQQVRKRIEDLPFDRRFERVDDISETLTAEQAAVPMTLEQKCELESRLEVYRAIRDPGDPAGEVIERIRARL